MNNIEARAIITDSLRASCEITDQVIAEARLYQTSNGNSYEITFQPGQKVGGFYNKYDDNYDKVLTTNVDSYQLYRNGDPVSVPFDCIHMDFINVKITPTNPAQTSTVKVINSSLPKQDKYRTQFKLDKTRRHLFVLLNTEGSSIQQKLAIIDTATDTVHSIINLPLIAGMSNLQMWCSPFYNNHWDVISLSHDKGYCYIEANPDSANFGLLINPFTGRTPDPNYYFASSNGDSYTWYDGLYDPYSEGLNIGVAWFGNDSYMYARGYNSTRESSQPSAAVSPTFIALTANKFNGRFTVDGHFLCQTGASCNYLIRKFRPFIWNDFSKISLEIWKEYGRGSVNTGWGTLIYIPSVNKYIDISNQARLIDNEDFSQVLNMGSITGSGTSAYYQSAGYGDYDPINKYVMAGNSYRVNNGGNYDNLFLVDAAANVMHTVLGMPNLSPSSGQPKLYPQIKYSHYSGKFYQFLLSDGIQTTVGGINIYDVGSWIAGGKVSMNDLYQGYIDFSGNRIGNAYSNKWQHMKKYIEGNWIDIVVD